MLEQHIIELTAAVKELTAALQAQPAQPVVEKPAPVKTEKPLPVATPAPVAETPAPVAETPAAVTYEQVRDKLQALLAKGGNPAVAAILKECGVERVPHLKTPEQWAQAYELAEKALA